MLDQTVDERWLRRTLLASRRRPGSSLPLISKLADRGVVWPLLGAALATRSSTRAAGGSGVAAVAVTTLTTWTIERVVQRGRPPRVIGLVSRGPARHPSSSSFPSTHAANAFAFAAATTTLNPPLGFILIPTAAAIALARVGIGHHYPGDVVAGAVIGGCIGIVSGLLVRHRTNTSRPDSADRHFPAP